MAGQRVGGPGQGEPSKGKPSWSAQYRLMRTSCRHLRHKDAVMTCIHLLCMHRQLSKRCCLTCSFCSVWPTCAKTSQCQPTKAL